MGANTYEGMTLAELESLRTDVLTSISRTLRGQKKDMEGRMLEMPELSELQSMLKDLNAAIALKGGTAGAKVQRGVPVMNK